MRTKFLLWFYTCILSLNAFAQNARTEFKQAELAYEAGKYKESLFYLGETERALGGSNARIQSLKTLNYYEQGDNEAALLALTQYFKLATETTRASEQYKDMVALRDEIKAANENIYTDQKKAILAAKAKELATLEATATSEKEIYYFNLVKDTKSPTAMRDFLNEYPKSIHKNQLEESIKNLEFEQDKMKNPEKYLFGAIQQNDQKLITELLEYGSQVDIKNDDGQYPIHLAIEKSNLKMVQQLLTYGANQEVKDNNGNTPLLLALRQNKEIFASEFLANGANVKVTDKSLNSPVFFAIANNSINQLEGLIVFKADVSSLNQEGYSPLVSAISRLDNTPEIIEALLKGGAAVDQVVLDYTPLYYAVRENKNDITRILLKAGANPNVSLANGSTLLYIATSNNNITALELLLKEKADPNKKAGNDWTPLHFASWKANVSVADLLVSYGAAVNATGPHGWTPLHYATRENNLPMVEWLLTKKADKKARDEWKRTPLKVAREYHFKTLKKKLS